MRETKAERQRKVLTVLRLWDREVQGTKGRKRAPVKQGRDEKLEEKLPDPKAIAEVS